MTVDDMAWRICQTCIVVCAMVGVSALATGFSRDRAFIASQTIPRLTRMSLRRWRCNSPSHIEKACMVAVLALVACGCVWRLFGTGGSADGTGGRVLADAIVSIVAIQLCAMSCRRAHSRWLNPDAVGEGRGRPERPASRRSKPAAGLGVRLATEEEMLHRARLLEGDSLPLVASTARRGHAPVWAVPAASGLRIGDGVVTDAVSALVKVRIGASPWHIPRQTTRRRIGFMRVRFTDPHGAEHCAWSGPTRCKFRPGERVHIYWYLADSADGMHPAVQDVADASRPVSMQSHAVAMHSLALAEAVHRADRTSAPAGGGQGEWLDAYEAGVVNVGYEPGGCPSPVSASEWFEEHPSRGVSREYHAPTPALFDGLREPGVSFPSVVMHRHKAVVCDARVVPLFNRFGFCGYGYMALVEFAGTRSWAFGDPERKSSYLGWKEADAVIPVAVGMVVTVWTSAEYSFVDPTEGDRAT